MKYLKKSIALLAAVTLLTASSAVYAAQVPSGDVDSQLVAANSARSLGASITLDNYDITGSTLTASFYGYPSGGQFRAAKYTVTAEQEDVPGSSIFYPAGECTVDQLGANYITVKKSFYTVQGARVRITVSVTGDAFNGYNYIGQASGSQVFYFTM